MLFSLRIFFSHLPWHNVGMFAIPSHGWFIICLGVSTPPEKYESLGMIIPNIRKNNEKQKMLQTTNQLLLYPHDTFFQTRPHRIRAVGVRDVRVPELLVFCDTGIVDVNLGLATAALSKFLVNIMFLQT